MYLQQHMQHIAQRHNYCEPGFIFLLTPLSMRCIIVVALGINLQLITHPTALSTCPLALLPPIHALPYFGTALFCNYPILQLPDSVTPPILQLRVPHSINQPHPPFYNYILFRKSTTCFCTLHPLISKLHPLISKCAYVFFKDTLQFSTLFYTNHPSCVGPSNTVTEYKNSTHHGEWASTYIAREWLVSVVSVASTSGPHVHVVREW